VRRFIPILGGILLGLVAIAAVWWFLRPQPDATPVRAIISDVVALVNGEAITRTMVEAEINVGRATNLLSLEELGETLPPFTAANLERAQEEATGQLIQRHLILQAAARDGFRLEPGVADERVELLYGSFGQEKLEAALQRTGATRADLTWWVGEITLMERYTFEVIMADAVPEDRQRMFNNWLNARQAEAVVVRFTAEGAISPAALAGSLAPDFSAVDLNGRPVGLSRYAGQVILVNFWATWCPSCIAEMPAYEQVYRRHRDQGFVVLAVNFQESETVTASFAQSLGLTYSILRDVSGDMTTRQYQVVGMPSSFIVDRSGRIFYRHAGPMSGALLEEKLAELGIE
jgi:peroxiredoxin